MKRILIAERLLAQCRGTKFRRSQPRNILSVQTYSNLPVALLFINFLRLFNPIDQGRVSGLKPSLVLLQFVFTLSILTDNFIGISMFESILDEYFSLPNSNIQFWLRLKNHVRGKNLNPNLEVKFWLVVNVTLYLWEIESS